MSKPDVAVWPSFLLVGGAAAASLVCTLLIAIVMGIAW
jgi:hypothetical protein